MEFNSKTNIQNSDLYVAEDDGLELDYEEIRAGIERAREDIKCGRYSDINTCLERIRKRFSIEWLYCHSFKRIWSYA